MRAFVHSIGSVSPPFVPRLSAGLRAALLAEIAQSGWTQAIGLLLWANCRERSLSHSSLTLRYSLVGSSENVGPWASSPGVGICFLIGHAPGNGRRKKQPKSAAPSATTAGCFSAPPIEVNWFDPLLSKASLSSLLVSLKNASIMVPYGTQTNLDCQLRSTQFQGFGLTSVLFPLLPIQP